MYNEILDIIYLSHYEYILENIPFKNFIVITDTAVVYRNEEHIGYALKNLLPKYNLQRSDIFITTKLCMYQ